MRISDWSSDVCSSDLADPDQDERRTLHHELAPAVEVGERRDEEMVERAAGIVAHGEEKQEAGQHGERDRQQRRRKIGRASCRERVCQYVSISVVAVSLKKNNKAKEENTNHIIK